MNKQATAPRFAAVTLAALMTLATLTGIGLLADLGTAHVQMAQARTTVATGV